LALTGEEIRRRLIEFAEHWSLYDGSERAEAQTYLNQLFECYGTNRRDVATFEQPQQGGFVDLLWRRTCIFEMKRPSEAERLSSHRVQAFEYWRRAADSERNVPAPKYLVICAFSRMEIWQPGEYPQAPRLEVELIELPDRYEALLFLAGREPVFTGGHEAITRDAVSKLTGLYHRLRERRAADPEVLRDFTLQSVWAMFAEDLGMLEAQLFTRLIDRLLEDRQRSSVDDLGQLFTYLNTEQGGPDHGLYASVRYVNGGLFRRPAHVHLEAEELVLLREACESDWTRVQPSIFGSLMEGGLGHDMQWALAAHYTHEADIKKVIGPSIVEPWRERIGNIETHRDARAAQDELMRFVVLDPACGSGNFLYLAYRELRRIERDLHRREVALRRAAGTGAQAGLSLFFPLSNVRGVEINGFAVAVARVTLWMGHKLAVDELELDERTLPLADLSGIQQGDALRVPWPRADAIVGNPPFHGDRNLRGLLGDDYVEWLKREFDVGIKDYCVYWFRKTHDHLEDGKRAGLVGTNSITQNRARGPSIGYVLEKGGTITNAVSSQDWPGEANVDVSIVNWRKGQEPNGPAELDGVAIEEPIAASLRPWSLAVERAGRLAANEGYAFYGPIPGGAGFVLDIEEAEELLGRHGDNWRTIVRPYLVGDDVLNQPDHGPSRFIIDFGFRSLEEASAFAEALQIVRERVKPQRDRVRRRTYRENWWRFSEPIREMREALDGLPRYIAGPAQGKRILFTWVDPWTCPSNLTTVFAFDDYYAMGILSSGIHRAWAIAQASTLEDRTRYTTTSTFDTFPWPAPDAGTAASIADSALALVELRDQLCLEHELGLTDLYNRLDEGGFRSLAEAHHNLDRAVAAAYEWPPTTATDEDEVNRRLLGLNEAIISEARTYRGPAGAVSANPSG
jgi:hypothetical protein